MPFKILVADDRPENRDILTRLLEQAGFETVQASDGAEAVPHVAPGASRPGSDGCPHAGL